MLDTVLMLVMEIVLDMVSASEELPVSVWQMELGLEMLQQELGLLLEPVSGRRLPSDLGNKIPAHLTMDYRCHKHLPHSLGIDR